MAAYAREVVVGNPQTIAYGTGLNAGTQLIRLTNGDIVVPVDYAGDASSYASLSEAGPGELIACLSSTGLPTPPGIEQPTFVCTVRIRLKEPPVYKWP